MVLADMDGIKPLVLTFVAWTGIQLSTDELLTPKTAEAVGMIFPILSSALILALVAAAMKYGRLTNKVDNLSEEVDRLRKRLDK
jgi:hypothetical protein